MILSLVLITGILLKNSNGFPQTLQVSQQANISPLDNTDDLTPHNPITRSISYKHLGVNNVEKTVEEVESIIKTNPSLPRLTRGEILDILENITKADLEAPKSLERDPKAIMVVMPFTPETTNDNGMQEFYTKPPVTHIVGNEAPLTTTTIRSKPHFRRKPTKPTTLRPDPENHASKIVTSTTQPSISTTNVQRRQRRPTGTTESSPVTTYRSSRKPLRRRPSTSTTKHPNHKYDENEPENTNKFSSTGIRIIDAPKLAPTVINQELQSQDHSQNELFTKTPEYVPQKEKPAATGVNLNVPHHLKKVVNDLQLETLKEPQPFISESDLSAKQEAQRIKNLLAEIGVYTPSTTTTTTTTTAVPDASILADNLNPDMRNLLMSFGLIPNDNKIPESANQALDQGPEKAEVKPESYIGFKPLPENAATKSELEDFLAQFGLGRNARKHKSIKNNNEKEINLDVVPENFRHVLEDVGLVDRQGRRIRSQPGQNFINKEHVFNPVESQNATDEELQKLNKLLNVVKQLEKLNGTITDEDLKKMDIDSLKQLLASLNHTKLVPLDSKDAPDPLNYDYGLIKNEVKRQQEKVTTVTALNVEEETKSNVSSVETSTTATEETKSPSLTDLEDSFGGKTTTTPQPETTTPEKRTGFYYLVDWNTFFEIDDQKGKRVNLRFQPKIGDPKRFYSVTVP